VISPSASPVPAIPIASRSTIRLTLAAEAPSAILTPISCVRSETV